MPRRLPKGIRASKRYKSLNTLALRAPKTSLICATLALTPALSQAKMLLETKRARSSSKRCHFIKLQDLACGPQPTTAASPSRSSLRAMVQPWDYKRDTKNLPSQGQTKPETDISWTINQRHNLSNLPPCSETLRSFHITRNTSRTVALPWSNNSITSTCPLRQRIQARSYSRYKRSHILTLQRRKAVRESKRKNHSLPLSPTQYLRKNRKRHEFRKSTLTTNRQVRGA